MQALLDLPNRIALEDLHQYWFRGGYPEPWVKNSPRFVTTQHPLDFVLWQGASSAESVAYGLYVRIRASQQRRQRAKDEGC